MKVEGVTINDKRKVLKCVVDLTFDMYVYQHCELTNVKIVWDNYIFKVKVKVPCDREGDKSISAVISFLFQDYPMLTAQNNMKVVCL